MQELEIEYFRNNNSGIAQELMHWYYERADYFLLYFLANVQYKSNTATPLTLSYYLVSLYEIGEIKVLQKIIDIKAIDLYALITDKMIPENLRNHLMKVILNQLHSRENVILPNIPMQKYNLNDNGNGYDVISYSEKIGCNMTVIRTHAGVIIFDCGASQENDRIISLEEFKTFFSINNIKKEDVVAVFISHAHYDHYGSIQNLVSWGVPWTKVFANEFTQDLIGLSNNNLSIKNAYGFNDFRNSRIKVTPFKNGHILGSVGFLITIDGNLNILYSGDFCFHNQKCVEGLRPETLKDLLNGKEIDCLIIETTYGNKPIEASYKTNVIILKKIIEILLVEEVKMFFPAFAIGRSQEIIEILKETIDANVRIDGLSSRITEYIDSLNYRPKLFTRNINSLPDDPDKVYKMQINAAIVSSSGMLSVGSTSYDYLNQILASNNIDLTVRIIKTGFIIPNTDGDLLLNKWSTEKNEVLEISLSAHASYYELLELIEIVHPKKVLQIHGAGLY